MMRAGRVFIHALVILALLWSVHGLCRVFPIPMLQAVLDLVRLGWYVPVSLAVSAGIHRADAVLLCVQLVTLLTAPLETMTAGFHALPPFFLGLLIGRGLRRVFGDFSERRRYEPVPAARGGRDDDDHGVLRRHGSADAIDGDGHPGPAGDADPYAGAGSGRRVWPPLVVSDRGGLRDLPPDAHADGDASVHAVPPGPVRPTRPPARH